MKTIELTQGKVTVVDDDVYEWASKFKWRAFKKRNTFYAIRTVGKKPNHRSVFLHREILKPPANLEVDHRDGDGLHNLRENLRPATHGQNMCAYNHPRPNKTSSYRGVHKASALYKTKPWAASLKINGKKQHLGYFTDEETAARVYDAAAREAYGEFAQLNF